MRNQYEIIVQCPHCGQNLEYNVFTVVDGAKEPYQKLALMNDQFFELTCSSCGQKMNMVYEFMYHDSEKNYSIYFINDEHADGANVAIQINNMFMKESGHQQNVTRIVSSYEELLEKINILDNGLDDRVAEIMKFFCIHHALAEISQVGVYDAHYCFHEGKHCFRLEGENGEAIAEFPDGMYETVTEEFAEAIDSCRTLIVNQDWAISVVKDIDFDE